MPKRTKRARSRMVPLPRPSDEVLAHHEAAHCVAAVRAGYGVASVSIRAKGDFYGLTQALLAKIPVRTAREARRFAVTALVGLFAELRSGAAEDAAWAGAWMDLRHAKEALGSAGLTLASGIRAAKRFVSNPRHSKAIRTVARELIRERELDACEVAMLVNISDGGECTRRDLARYRAIQRARWQRGRDRAR